MNLKIDTKEKFHVITPDSPVLSVNMTDELGSLLLSLLEKEVKNVIFNLKNVKEISTEIANLLVQLQQHFYEHQASFVICEILPVVEQWLDERELLELLNVTPTESEAWDIVQMEEIEREFLED
jgi:anti-anti-sigma regulatory factor